MKKIVLILTFFCLFQEGKAQKPLSKQAIYDFAAACWFNYRSGNEYFIATMNTYLPYQRSDIALLMEHLDTDKKGREEVFKLFYRISSGVHESLFNNLYSLKLSADEAKELTEYIISQNTKHDTGFEGTKKYDDGSYLRAVSILKGKVVIITMPSPKNSLYKDKLQIVSRETGYFKNGDIFIKDGNKYAKKYGIEDGNLVILEEEGE